MHFTFPITTIASVAGAATLLAPVTSHVEKVKFAHDLGDAFGSRRAKAEGSECSIVNAFKVHEASADAGILDCGYGMVCVEDKISSSGGRCMLLEEDKDWDVESRQLSTVACTYSNGTTGVKCNGSPACSNLPVENVGCGSCNGDGACLMQYEPTSSFTVGEKSCNGNYACYYSTNDVGDGSCNGYGACAFSAYSADVGDGSCNGYRACMFSAYFDVGDGSCNGYGTCYRNSCMIVGDSECNGDAICQYGCPTPAPTTTTTPGYCFPNASKVKLQSTTGAPISVFEIEVLADGANVAEGKTATQGSTFKGKSKFAASEAVDGDTTTFSHTDRNGCSWLEVDFEGLFEVESISISNRWCGDASDSNGCLCKLSHATVSLLDDEGNWVDGTWLADTCGVAELKHNFTAVAC